jgi:hypothetical protein
VRTSSRQGGNGSPIALDRIRWKGEQNFRMLSYYFSVRWTIEAAGEYIGRWLSDFAVPRDPEEYVEVWAPGVPPQYSIMKRRSGPNPYHLLYGDGVMLQSDKLTDILARLVWHVHSRALRQTGDFLLVHAGAVSTPAGEGILLPAPAGYGKTTLVTALVRAGFLYLSDEAGAVDPVSRRLYPFQRPITLKKGHAAIFPDLYRSENGSASAGGGMCHVRPEDVGARGGPCRIRFVVAHRYRPDAPTQITPLTPAQGAMELLTNALNLPRYRSRALPLVADVARRARSYRLVSGNLDEAVRAITELTGRRRRTPARAG